MKQRIRHLLYFIILVTLDQVSKYWARTSLQEDGPISIIPGVFKLQYHENTGAVWGIMSGKTGFLAIISLILLAILLFLYFKIPQKRRYLPIQIIWVFIMAGALGNIIDRIMLRYVVDFLYFELINFPIFNMADSYLTVSSLLLFILGIFYYKDEDLEFIDSIFKKNPTQDKSSKNKDISKQEALNGKENNQDDKSNG